MSNTFDKPKRPILSLGGRRKPKSDGIPVTYTGRSAAKRIPHETFKEEGLEPLIGRAQVTGVLPKPEQGTDFGSLKGESTVNRDGRIQTGTRHDFWGRDYDEMSNDYTVAEAVMSNNGRSRSQLGSMPTIEATTETIMAGKLLTAGPEVAATFMGLTEGLDPSLHGGALGQDNTDPVAAIGNMFWQHNTGNAQEPINVERLRSYVSRGLADIHGGTTEDQYEPNGDAANHNFDFSDGDLEGWSIEKQRAEAQAFISGAQAEVSANDPLGAALSIVGSLTVARHSGSYDVMGVDAIDPRISIGASGVADVSNDPTGFTNKVLRVQNALGTAIDAALNHEALAEQDAIWERQNPNSSRMKPSELARQRLEAHLSNELPNAFRDMGGKIADKGEKTSYASTLERALNSYSNRDDLNLKANRNVIIDMQYGETQEDGTTPSPVKDALKVLKEEMRFKNEGGLLPSAQKRGETSGRSYLNDEIERGFVNPMDNVSVPTSESAQRDRFYDFALQNEGGEAIKAAIKLTGTDPKDLQNPENPQWEMVYLTAQSLLDDPDGGLADQLGVKGIADAHNLDWAKARKMYSENAPAESFVPTQLNAREEAAKTAEREAKADGIANWLEGAKGNVTWKEGREMYEALDAEAQAVHAKQGEARSAKEVAETKNVLKEKMDEAVGDLTRAEIKQTKNQIFSNEQEKISMADLTSPVSEAQVRRKELEAQEVRQVMRKDKTLTFLEAQAALNERRKVEEIQPDGGVMDAIREIESPSTVTQRATNRAQGLTPEEAEARWLERTGVTKIADDGSDDWKVARKTKFTSTGAVGIAGSTPGRSMAEALGGWLKGDGPTTIGPNLFEAGHIAEDKALEWYSRNYDSSVFKPGLITKDHESGMASTPDAISQSQNAVVEVKSRTHFLGEDPDNFGKGWSQKDRKKYQAYYAQMQHQMHETGAERADLLEVLRDPSNSGALQDRGNPDANFRVTSVQRDEDFIKMNKPKWEFQGQMARTMEQASGGDKEELVKMLARGTSEGVLEAHEKLKQMNPDLDDNLLAGVLNEAGGVTGKAMFQSQSGPGRELRTPFTGAEDPGSGGVYGLSRTLAHHAQRVEALKAQAGGGGGFGKAAAEIGAAFNAASSIVTGTYTSIKGAAQTGNRRAQQLAELGADSDDYMAEVLEASARQGIDKESAISSLLSVNDAKAGLELGDPSGMVNAITGSKGAITFDMYQNYDGTAASQEKMAAQFNRNADNLGLSQQARSLVARKTGMDFLLNQEELNRTLDANRVTNEMREAGEKVQMGLAEGASNVLGAKIGAGGLPSAAEYAQSVPVSAYSTVVPTGSEMISAYSMADPKALAARSVASLGHEAAVKSGGTQTVRVEVVASVDPQNNTIKVKEKPRRTNQRPF